MQSKGKNLVRKLHSLTLLTVMPILIQSIIMNITVLPAFSLTDPSSIESSKMWTSGANMITPRTDFAGTSLNDKIYIIGGFDNTGKQTDIVEYYDPNADTWSTASSLPIALDHPAAAAYNGTLYVVGGYTREYKGDSSDRTPSDRLFIYNPSTDKWDEGKSMPNASGALTANFINGTLYAVGGLDDSRGATGSNTAYDPKTNSWKEKTPMPTAREHLASAVVDGKLYVVGGRVGGYDNNLDANEVYDPIKNTWTSLEPMPSKRGGLAAASSVNGDIYVFGGEERAGTFDNNERYDPNTDKWTEDLPMPTARHGLASVAINDKIYVVGGGPEPGLIVGGRNEIFSITNNRTNNTP
jgi:N-acetylneuraminic acid mutarotase